MNQNIFAWLSQVSSSVTPQALRLGEWKRWLDEHMYCLLMNSYKIQVRRKENVAFSRIFSLKILWSALLIVEKPEASSGTQQTVPHQSCFLPWVLQMHGKPPVYHVSCFGFVLFFQGWCTNPIGPDGMGKGALKFLITFVPPTTTPTYLVVAGKGTV